MIQSRVRGWDIVFLLVACMVSVVRADERRVGSDPFILTHQDADSWKFEYTPLLIPATTITIEGTEYLLFSGSAGSLDGDAGKPQLPVEALSLGIPVGVQLRAELLDAVYREIPDQLIAPFPSYTYSEEREAIPEYQKSVSAYSQNRFFPLQSVAVDAPHVLRQQRITTIRIHPYQYNPVTRILKQLVKATIHIRLTYAPGRAQEPSLENIPADPHFEKAYKSLLKNYEQAKQWRIPIAVEQQNRGLDPTRDWFETGRTYYRIRVANDGWYKVTTSDLAAAGADISQIDINTLKVFGKGLEVPVFIRPDTTIEFYALMHHGDSTFLDFYTDTNTYWLTWGGSVQGQRFTTTSQPGGSPGLNVVSAKVTRHFEHNTDYYDGTGDVELSETGAVPGEGWVWDYYFPGTVYNHAFSTDEVDGITAPTSTLRLRLFSMTPNFNPVDHDAKILINDSLVTELLFRGRTEQLVSTTFPTSLLSDGPTGRPAANGFKIQSIPTSSIPNQFYLDWFEIDYQRFLRAQADQLVFTSPNTSGPNPALFTVTGFTNSRIDVFDLTGRRKIVGGIVSGDSVTGFSIAFRDSFSTVKQYLVVGAGGQRSVLPLASRTFTDIRLNPAGADYVIISHRLFLSSAQQLGAHRQSVNGVRVRVIDVQDIYDEFNYGILNANAIKRFLHHAYLNWPVPSLTYVLMFGDACWDYHRYIPSTTSTNYVPAYGVPAGDNWFGCFNPDTTFLPSLLIGRLPVRDSVQARRTVAKVMAYDGYELADWNKNFMFITGGITVSEQASFNNLSNFTITTYVTPSPIGGTPYRIYKNTPAVIDGENKGPMRNLIRDGLVYLNFLGHSGGAVWGVDIGDPNTLENTNGKLPFISSVSCNVGAFAEPFRTMLAEDLMLADNRGAIAVWASSSLGYASAGASLNQYFLNGVTNGVRDLGNLTTAARLRLWQTYGSYYIYVAMVNLNPLLGDPLTRLAIPLAPDLAVGTQDVVVNKSTPTPNDSTLSIRLSIHNYGLVPLDSVGLSITDTYNGQTIPVLSNGRIAATRHRDTLYIPWVAAEQVGRHTLTTVLDPTSGIPEVNELNNAAAIDQYVYANVLSVVKPLNNMVVLPGVQTLIVTSPLGLDSLGFHYIFELDTVATFDSPFRVLSGPIAPGPVSGQWITPSLTNNQVFFWRARTEDGDLTGNWVVSSFSTSSLLPNAPLVRWREGSKKQFDLDQKVQAVATDSGVTIAPNQPLHLYGRSLGTRAASSQEYYTILKLNELTVTGFWWVTGSGFMVLRVNEFNSSYEYRTFSPAGDTAQALGMKAFIDTTPAGNYLLMVSVFDPRGGVTESLYVALESLGSTRIRQAVYGQSWAMIGRKGYPNAALESLTNDSAIVDLHVPNYYSYGAGSVTTPKIIVPTSWGSFHWEHASSPPATTTKVAILGVRTGGAVDTLRILSGDSVDVSLAFLNPLTSGPTYSSYKLAGLLSANDALQTPILKDWWVDAVPPGDLAVSSRTIGVQEQTIRKGDQIDLPITVYNIGFHGADSARVVVSVFDKLNKARPIASAMLDTIGVNGTKSTTIPIATTNFSRRVTLQVNVSPSKKYKDLVPENNNAYYTFNVIGAAVPGIQFFADGAQLMDGDYVVTKPKLVIRLPEPGEGGQATRRVDFFVDNTPFVTPSKATTVSGDVRAYSDDGDELTFAPDLSVGNHELKVRLIEASSIGGLDTLEQSLTVEVSDRMRIVDLYNYPNPFSTDTYFTFKLAGDVRPEELSIRIFTISGRRIREIVVPQHQLAGFNRVYWDGRDADGDELANGYYFFQVTIRGGGKIESTIQKLAKIR